MVVDMGYCAPEGERPEIVIEAGYGERELAFAGGCELDDGTWEERLSATVG
jgi:hypothetical protein